MVNSSACAANGSAAMVQARSHLRMSFPFKKDRCICGGIYSGEVVLGG